MNIIIAILIFSFIIIFHELGHFLTARACGVKVNEFCLGFGPKIIGFTKGETLYAWRLIPFGGACVMEGEDQESDNDRAFGNKPVWQRFLIVLMGPMFNFLLAFILSAILLAAIGVMKPKIGGVMEDYPAQEAGLEAGDEITALGGHRVYFYQEISAYVFFHGKEAISVTYSRGGQSHQTTLVPRYDEESKRYLIGIQGPGDYEKLSAGQIAGYSFHEIRYQIYNTAKSLQLLVTGQVSLRQISGPVGIVKTIGDTYQQSARDGAFYIFVNMLSIAILLTANLGVMNLLPFPALDGGRLVFFLVEMIRRKPAPQKLEGYVNMAGFVLLMGLMILVVFSDLFKIFA
ncbi:M50 family metallopeptidase [Shuttleworthella satelles]|uniref:M50 family metallopeptidase n=1 Tax=Shuttleworthella satelles TaxID=177972 RepID=UPI0028CFEE8C|nr:M50 family metallopeptidase [Shuttleworthia satelles]